MPDISSEEFEQLLPLACSWAEEQEARIPEHGQPLTAMQHKAAVLLGVAAPQRVRLLSVDQIPLPQHPALCSAAEAAGLISPFTGGMTLRYGIFIRADRWNDRALVAHELVHVRQYERLGGFEEFLRRYLWECLTIGYPEAPLEQEAIEGAAGLGL